MDFCKSLLDPLLGVVLAGFWFIFEVILEGFGDELCLILEGFWEAERSKQDKD